MNNSKLVWEYYNALFEKADGLGHQYRLGLWKPGEYRLFIEQKKTGIQFERIHATADLCKLQAQQHEDSITSILAERDEKIFLLSAAIHDAYHENQNLQCFKYTGKRQEILDRQTRILRDGLSETSLSKKAVSEQEEEKPVAPDKGKV